MFFLFSIAAAPTALRSLRRSHAELQHVKLERVKAQLESSLQANKALEAERDFLRELIKGK